MSSDLSKQYNEGIIPTPPALKADVPQPHQPVKPTLPEHELDTRNLKEIMWAIIITLVILGGTLLTQWLGGF